MARMSLLPIVLLALAQQIEGVQEVQIGIDGAPNDPVCWDVLNPKSLILPKPGTVSKVRLVYTSGGFTCSASTDAANNHWGCGAISTAIRDSQNTANLWPATGTAGLGALPDPVTGEYTLTGQTVSSAELILDGPEHRVSGNLFLNFAASVQYDVVQSCANVFVTYLDDPSNSESESESPVQAQPSESESQSESVSESESSSESVSPVNVADPSNSQSELASVSESESESPLGQPASPSESESESESPKPSDTPANSPSPNASPSQAPSASQVASASPAASGNINSILPTSRARTSPSPFSGIRDTASRRPTRSPPKRRSASPAGPVVSRRVSRGEGKASPARKPSPEQPHRKQSPENNKRASPERKQASPVRTQQSPKDKKRRDIGEPSPHAAYGFAASVDHIDSAEAAVAPAEGSNAALYGLFALIPIVGVAAVAAWRFSRKTPEVVDFDKAADNA